MIEAGIAAVAAYVATDLDDILMLSVLFAGRDETFRTRTIVVGQSLGFAGVVLVSIALSRGLAALPDVAVGLLGLIPIALGVHGLLRARGGTGAENADVPLTAAGLAAVTLANGGDDIAVFAPLFATFDASGLAVAVVVFAVLFGGSCAAGLLIGTRPAVVRAVEWGGAYAIPVMLIALGCFIVWEAGLLA